MYIWQVFRENATNNVRQQIESTRLCKIARAPCLWPLVVPSLLSLPLWLLICPFHGPCGCPFANLIYSLVATLFASHQSLLTSICIVVLHTVLRTVYLSDVRPNQWRSKFLFVSRRRRRVLHAWFDYICWRQNEEVRRWRGNTHKYLTTITYVSGRQTFSCPTTFHKSIKYITVCSACCSNLRRMSALRREEMVQVLL